MRLPRRRQLISESGTGAIFPTSRHALGTRKLLASGGPAVARVTTPHHHPTGFLRFRPHEIGRCRVEKTAEIKLTIVGCQSWGQPIELCRMRGGLSSARRNPPSPSHHSYVLVSRWDDDPPKPALLLCVAWVFKSRGRLKATLVSQLSQPLFDRLPS